MTRGRRKKTTAKAKPDKNTRQDLPEEDSIVEEKEFTSPKGNKYRIIVTNENDPYDRPEDISEKCNDEKTG